MVPYSPIFEIDAVFASQKIQTILSAYSDHCPSNPMFPKVIGPYLMVMTILFGSLMLMRRIFFIFCKSEEDIVNFSLFFFFFYIKKESLKNYPFFFFIYFAPEIPHPFKVIVTYSMIPWFPSVSHWVAQ